MFNFNISLKISTKKCVHISRTHEVRKQGFQSTKNIANSTAEGCLPVSEELNIKTNQVCYAIIDPSNNSRAYMDLTGIFPKRSSRGNEHILVGYHYDANYIHGMPLNN